MSISSPSSDRKTPTVSLEAVAALLENGFVHGQEQCFLDDDNNPLFRQPVVGVQPGDSPGFVELKIPIPCHLTPVEMWESEFSERPECLSVISYAVPFTETIIRETAKCDDKPALSWFKAKLKFADAAKIVRQQLFDYFTDLGIRALHPESSKAFGFRQQDNGRGYPTWSLRHVGYACGVGSFGLHGALITKRGAAQRLDSLIIDAPFDTYTPMAESPFADCLYIQNGTCGACISRCPAGAINKDNIRDIDKCQQQSYEINGPEAEAILGSFVGGCALCNTRVPCASKSPISGHK